jgi:hypothetical protein
MSSEELCNQIKSEARNLDVPRLKVAGGKGMSAQVDAGTSRHQGRNGARDKPQSKKVNVDGRNCGKHGHMARDCRAPWTDYAHRPKRRETGAGSDTEPKALMSNLSAGKKETWADMVDGQEWVVDSGA